MRKQSQIILILSVVLFLLFIAGVPSSFKISLGTLLALALAVVAFFHYRSIHPAPKDKTIPVKRDSAPYMENVVPPTTETSTPIHDTNRQP